MSDQETRNPGPPLIARAVDRCRHWMLAVEMQYARIQKPQPPDEAFGSNEFCDAMDQQAVDIDLFVMALRVLLDSVELCRNVVDDQERQAKLIEALAAFRKTVPHTVPMRDFIEHPDQYVQGK